MLQQQNHTRGQTSGEQYQYKTDKHKKEEQNRVKYLAMWNTYKKVQTLWIAPCHVTKWLHSTQHKTHLFVFDSWLILFYIKVLGFFFKEMKTFFLFSIELMSSDLVTRLFLLNFSLGPDFILCSVQIPVYCCIFQRKQARVSSIPLCTQATGPLCFSQKSVKVFFFSNSNQPLSKWMEAHHRGKGRREVGVT